MKTRDLVAKPRVRKPSHRPDYAKARSGSGLSVSQGATGRRYFGLPGGELATIERDATCSVLTALPQPAARCRAKRKRGAPTA